MTSEASKAYDVLYAHMKNCNQCMTAYTEHKDDDYCNDGLFLFNEWYVALMEDR